MAVAFEGTVVENSSTNRVSVVFTLPKPDLKPIICFVYVSHHKHERVFFRSYYRDFARPNATPVATVTTWVRVTGVQTGSAGACNHSWSAAFCTHFTLNLEGKQMI